MQKWEYLFVNTEWKNGAWRVHTVNGEDVDSENAVPMHIYANKIGEDGWELVSAPYTSDSFNNIKPRLIFKRPSHST